MLGVCLIRKALAPNIFEILSVCLPKAKISYHNMMNPWMGSMENTLKESVIIGVKQEINNLGLL